MDLRPIGVFDSGLGGLTTVRQLMKILPNESIIYFGDTGRVPYGGRSVDTIQKYARQDVNFLTSNNVKALIVACNTADTTAGAVLKREFDVRIFGVVEPSAVKAAKTTKNNRIGLIGTVATKRSGAYEKIIGAVNPRAEVRSVACPLFVPLVENGKTRPGDVVIETVTAEYLKPLKDWGCDILMLGCTHYPLLEEVIGRYMGPGVRLINSGVEAAQVVKDWLSERDMLSDPGGLAQYSYFVSDSTEGFTELASGFLERDICGTVRQIDIDLY